MDGNPDKQADDLLALLHGQSAVQAGAQFGEQVSGRLGQFRGVRRLQGGHATLQLRLLGGDPLELGSQIVLASNAADHEPDGPLPLRLERLERPGEGDRLGHTHGSLGIALVWPVEVRQGVTRVPKPALDVRPDLRLDRVRPDRPTPAGQIHGHGGIATVGVPSVWGPA